MTQFVIILDASIVNVALPSIGTDLELSQDDLSWVVNAYTLTFGGFLLLGGRLADLLGRRRMFISGLILFGLSSLAGGLAAEEWQLIAARALQGLGAAHHLPRRPFDRDHHVHRGRASATPRSASGAPWPAPAAPPACCWAACSPSTWAGSGCCG